MTDNVVEFMNPMIRKWADHMRGRALSERTIAEQTKTVIRIANEIGAPPLALTADQLVEWFAHSKVSAGSKATYRTSLRAWFDYLTLFDIRMDDPTRKLGKMKPVDYQPRPMHTAHLIALLHSGIRSRTRSEVLLGAYEGFRVSEIAAVRGEHIDRVGKQIYVEGKGGTRRWLPLHPVIDLESRRYPARGYWFPSHVLPGVPISGKSVSRSLSDAMSRAGVPGTPHSLRHWYATELRRAGVDLRTIQELMRHKSISTTQRYMKVDDSEMSKAMAKLPDVMKDAA